MDATDLNQKYKRVQADADTPECQTFGCYEYEKKGPKLDKDGAEVKELDADGDIVKDLLGNDVVIQELKRKYRLVFAQQAYFSDHFPSKFQKADGTDCDKEVNGWVLQAQVKLENGNNLAMQDNFAWANLAITYSHGSCPVATTSKYYMHHQYKEQYYFQPPSHNDDKLALKCEKYPWCPELGTCVLGIHRFDEEAEQFNGAPAADRSFKPGQYVPTENFSPKGIISREKAHLFIAKPKWKWTTNLYRSSVHTLQLRVLAFGPDLGVVTLTEKLDRKSVV